MIIYNVTVKVDNETHDDWLQWMQENHIPDVMKTGYFKAFRVSRVISIKDPDGSTYAIQYDCESTAVLHQYQVKAAPALQRQHVERYGDKALAFRTLMEVVDEKR